MWLSIQLGVPHEVCHIGMFDVKNCKRVVELCKPIIEEYGNEKITKTIYIANDGKEFLTEEDCEKHETFVEKYFHVLSISVSDAILI